MPRITASYLACIGDRGFSYSSEVSGGVTLPVVADSTVNVAYKRSKKEDSTVALHIVHDCLALAKENATSSTDRGSARRYARQATRYIDVVHLRLPAIELDPPGTLDCRSADVGTQLTCSVTIKSVGVAALRIADAEVNGANSGDFRVGGECNDMTLAPGQSCMMTVQFLPSAPGERTAALVIHQNLPPPDHGTSLQLAGTGTGTSPPSAEHTLTVTVDNSAAAGGVTISSLGMDCRATCMWTIADGTTVTLTATFDQGSGQATWDGCDSAIGNTCTIDVTADRAVTAQLSPAVG